jgi:hypothetical protein
VSFECLEWPAEPRGSGGLFIALTHLLLLEVSEHQIYPT